MTINYCGGKRRHGRGPCTQPAGWGTPHVGTGRCKLHGGCAPSSVMAAEAEKARQAMTTYGTPRDISPPAALLEEVARTAGHVDWLAGQVRALAPEALVWGPAKRDEIGAAEFPGTNETETAHVHVWLDLYQKERKHLVDVSKAAIAAGIAERQVRLAEQHGRLIGDVLRRILGDPELALTDEQRRAVPVVARRHLSSVA